MKVFFSIIIPTYNRANFLVSTVLSVLQQRYSDFEVIVVDDGSTDNSREVVAQIDDERVVYLWKDNGERGTARNYGVKRARGRYVTFLDSDDKLYPNHLEEAAYLVAQHAPTVFHLPYEIEDANSGRRQSLRPIHGSLNKLLLQGNRLSCMGVFLRTDVALQYPFSEERRLSGSEDWLLWLQLAARYPFYYANRTTSCMIQHANRSVMNFQVSELRDRTTLLLTELRTDECFVQSFGKDALKKIEAHMYSYTALHLALSQNKALGIKYLLKASVCHPSEVIQRRTLAIVREIVL